MKPNFVANPLAFGSITIDPTRMHELIGETKIDWHHGMRRMVEALAPEMLAV